MPAVDVVDDTFVRASARDVLAATRGDWEPWLSRLRLRVDEDRGTAGVRWSVLAAPAQPMPGSAEVWLEPVPGGTVVHLYVRLDPAGPAVQGARRRDPGRLPDRVRRSWKRGLHRSKDRLEGES